MPSYSLGRYISSVGLVSGVNCVRKQMICSGVNIKSWYCEQSKNSARVIFELYIEMMAEVCDVILTTMEAQRF